MNDIMVPLKNAFVSAGCEAEISGEYLDMLAGKTLTEKVIVADFIRYAFTQPAPDGSKLFQFENEEIQALEEILRSAGTDYFLGEIKIPESRIKDAAEILKKNFVLNNAIIRNVETSRVRAQYVLLIGRVTATGDEKREFSFEQLINCTMYSVSESLPDLTEILFSSERIPDYGKFEIPPDLKEFLEKNFKAIAIRKIAPFITSVGKRLQRDFTTMTDYYNALLYECHVNVLEKKGGKRFSVEREESRIKALMSDFKHRTEELKRRHKIEIDVEITQRLWFSLPVESIDFTLFRKKNQKRMTIHRNMFTKSIDRPVCEVCFSVARQFNVCDEKLHLICPDCCIPCKKCGKDFCRACSAKCPHCE